MKSFRQTVNLIRTDRWDGIVGAADELVPVPRHIADAALAAWGNNGI